MFPIHPAALHGGALPSPLPRTRLSRTYHDSPALLSPLHPCSREVLRADNLHYLLCTKAGQEERSVLSLSVNFALSVGTSPSRERNNMVDTASDCTNSVVVGSLLTGDTARAKEFYMHTRDILGDLFDQTDYDIAQVLTMDACVRRIRH
jgi:hypothetical protein